MLDSMTFAAPMEHLAHMPAHTWMELGDGKAALVSSERAWNLGPTRYAEHDAYVAYSAAGMCGDLDASHRWLERLGVLVGKQLHQSLPADLVSARDEEQKGHLDAAIALLQKAAGPLASAGEMIPCYPADVRLGALYYRAGRYNDALTTFLAILKHRPRDPRALLGASQTYAKLGDRTQEAAYSFEFGEFWAGSSDVTMNDF
jgi:tetratricopeptide (TPR) repeat protein